MGFYKRAAGKPSITWPESVDEAARTLAAQLSAKAQLIPQFMRRRP